MQLKIKQYCHVLRVEQWQKQREDRIVSAPLISPQIGFGKEKSKLNADIECVALQNVKKPAVRRVVLKRPKLQPRFSKTMVDEDILP